MHRRVRPSPVSPTPAHPQEAGTLQVASSWLPSRAGRLTPALVCVGLASLACLTAAATSLRPVDLRCEGRSEPLGVDVQAPELSWVLDSAGRDARQTAWRVRVASTPALLQEGRADLWDSGKVAGGESLHLAYGGAPLGARLRCHWTVMVWDESDRPSAWSRPSWWEMGLLQPRDWTASWIGRGPERELRPAAGYFNGTEPAEFKGKVVHDGRSTLLRKAFVVEPGIQRARVYATGLGYYELHCNGRRVGRQVLAPAKTNYRQWVLYDALDLTGHLRPGTNVVGLQLGNGWFNPYPKWWQPYRMQWFGSPRALVQIHLDYADGRSVVVGSDSTWSCRPGPVLASCIYDGETYDATQEVEGWDRAGLEGEGWSLAQLVEPPGGSLVANPMPGMEVIERLRPKAVTEPQPRVQVFDLGQNIAGWVRLRVSGPRGTRVTLRYAEDLRPDGTLDRTSNEGAAATDVYVLRGGGRETYEPRFTFHGFRYVEVTGLPEALRRGDLEGCVVHNACAPAGRFECDNDLLNRIHRATVWSQRAAMMGYPLDCPQRDERLGWMGDAMVTAEEALFNFEAATFLRHWLEGIRRNQNPADGDISIVSPRPYTPLEPDPAWSSAALVTAWDYYVHTADRRFLEQHYDTMRRYVEFLGTRTTNGLLPKYWIGDWGTVVEGWQEGDPVSVGTGFYAWDAAILAKAARVLGREADGNKYERLAQSVRSNYNAAFYDRALHRYHPASQFSHAFALNLGLVEEPERQPVLEWILEDLRRCRGHLNVGVLGAKHLLDALTLEGRTDVAYALVNQRGYPGWAHLIESRTTLSEFWDLHGSHNHVMLGSVDAWFYRVLAGIQPDAAEPGYARVRVAPEMPAGLSRVKASVRTARGPVSVHWERSPRGRVDLNVELPANTRAIVRVPAQPVDRVVCSPARLLTRRDSQAVEYHVGSGAYRFRVEPGAEPSLSRARQEPSPTAP